MPSQTNCLPGLVLALNITTRLTVYKVSPSQWVGASISHTEAYAIIRSHNISHLSSPLDSGCLQRDLAQINLAILFCPVHSLDGGNRIEDKS